MQARSRKKVLFLITKSNWGGAQRYVYDLATSLDKNSYDIVVALGGDGTLAELLTHAGIRVLPLNTLERDVSFKKEWEFMKELWGVLKNERPHILHVNSSKAGALGTLLGRVACVPRVIFTAHGWAFNEDRPFFQKLIIKAIHYLTVICSHKTIAVSRAIVRQMNWPGAERRMKVINPGRVIGVMYGKEEARKIIIDFFPRLSPHLSHPWIMSIAELHPTKQLDVLIAAIAGVRHEFPQAIGIIIGEGEERERLEKIIIERTLLDSVFLVGTLTEAARFLKAGTVFALTSRSESYGYVLHEAGLAHLSIVATNVGGIPDIITSPREGLLVPSGNVQAFTAALVTTLRSPEEADKRADALEKKMKERTTDRMVLATTALYELPLS